MSQTRPADPPERAERPVPLETVPEGTSRPADWDVSSQNRTHQPDETLADRQAAERDARESRAAGEPQADGPAGATRESGYSTEREQGAAQPAPDDAEEQR